MQFTAISWNLFHGRDFPPDPELFTWRSRLLRCGETNATHVQVNRDLEAEFGELLGANLWDVALLQEAPPRFAVALARACGAEAHRVLTSRNALGWLRAGAARINPDLIASAEGGSNLTLIRASGPLGPIAERRELVIHRGRPERRAMAFTATESGVCFANLHATSGFTEMAAADVRAAARAASAWAGERSLLLGGDLNLRPALDPEIFDDLRERFGLDRSDRAECDRSPLGQRPGHDRTPHPLAGAPRERRQGAGRCDSLITLRCRRDSQQQATVIEIVDPHPCANFRARRQQQMADKKKAGTAKRAKAEPAAVKKTAARKPAVRKAAGPNQVWPRRATAKGQETAGLQRSGQKRRALSREPRAAA